MIIKGERVYLRALEEKDCDMLLELINDPETEKMIGGYSYPTSSAQQRDWLLNKANASNVLRCAIVPYDNNDEAVGTVILTDIDEKNGTAEIHTKISEKARGKGYGVAGISTTVDYAFKELRLNCIYCVIVSYNAASIKMVENCGFVKEGILRSRLYKDGSYQDLATFSIVKND